MPTPPDQNIPPCHLPPWEWYEARKNRAAGLQQPPASQGAAPPPAGPQEKVYIVPPFSFSFNFNVVGIDVPLTISSTGVTAKDIAWAERASKWASYIATGLDALEVGVSVVGGVVGPFDKSKEISGPLAIAGVGLGLLSTMYTNLADVMGGNTGVLSDGHHLTGLAYGKDSVVADRNTALGFAATALGMADNPDIAAPAAIGGLYVAVSQLDYDLQGLTGSGETGGRIEWHSWTDGGAWRELGHQAVSHWWQGAPPDVTGR